MGKVVDKKKLANGQIKLSLIMSPLELKNLKNTNTRVYAISQRAVEFDSKIIPKGESGKSLYLDIPKILKKEPVPWGNLTRCFRVDSKDKIFLCYVIDKLSL